MWDRRVVITWAAWAAFGVAFELWCQFNGRPNTPTLTDVVLKWFKPWIFIPFLVWLEGHFIVNYSEQNKWVKWFFGG